MSGISAQGSTLRIKTGDAGAPTLVKISGLQSFDGLDGSTDELEVTDLDSTAKEYINGIVDEGKFGFEVKLLSADPGQIALRAARSSGDVVGLELELPDGQVATFDVLVKTFPISGQTNTVMKVKVDTKITGAVVWS